MLRVVALTDLVSRGPVGPALLWSGHERCEELLRGQSGARALEVPMGGIHPQPWQYQVFFDVETWNGRGLCPRGSAVAIVFFLESSPGQG